MRRRMRIIGLAGMAAVAACRRPSVPSGRATPSAAATAQTSACMPALPADVEADLGPNPRLVSSPPGQTRRECYFLESTVDPAKVRGPSPSVDGKSIDFLNLEWGCANWERLRTGGTADYIPPIAGLGESAFNRRGIIGARKGDTCFVVFGRIERRFDAKRQPSLSLATVIAGRLWGPTFASPHEVEPTDNAVVDAPLAIAEGEDRWRAPFSPNRDLIVAREPLEPWLDKGETALVNRRDALVFGIRMSGEGSTMSFSQGQTPESSDTTLACGATRLKPFLWAMIDTPTGAATPVPLFSTGGGGIGRDGRNHFEGRTDNPVYVFFQPPAGCRASDRTLLLRVTADGQRRQFLLRSSSH